MQNNKSTKQGHKPTPPQDPETLIRFAELLKLRGLAPSTQEEYLRFVRKLTARTGGDPASLDEAQLRAHLLKLNIGVQTTI